MADIFFNNQFRYGKKKTFKIDNPLAPNLFLGPNSPLHVHVGTSHYFRSDVTSHRHDNARRIENMTSINRLVVAGKSILAILCVSLKTLARVSNTAKSRWFILVGLDPGAKVRLDLGEVGRRRCISYLSMLISVFSWFFHFFFSRNVPCDLYGFRRNSMFIKKNKNKP